MCLHIFTVRGGAIMADNSLDPNVSTGDWILTFFLSAIPLVGIIMIFVWAFGGGAKISKRNYARAVLILALISIVLFIIFGIIFATASSSIITHMSESYSFS